MTFQSFKSYITWKKFTKVFSLRGKLLLFVFIIYMITIPLTLQGPNATSRFLVTKSIVEEGRFWFPVEYIEEGSQYWLSPDYALIDDKLYSDKAPGVAFLSIPLFILGKNLGGFLMDLWPTLDSIVSPYIGYLPNNDILAVVGIQIGLCLLAAFGILRLYDVSRMMGVSERSSTLGALLTAFTTPYWVYARTMFGHVPAAVFLISSVYHVLKYRESKNNYHLIAAGFFSGFGFVIEFPSLFAIPWLTMLILLPISRNNFSWKERFKSVFIYGTATTLSAFPLFYYNYTNFGSILANVLSFSPIWAATLHLLEPIHEGIVVLLLNDSRGLIYFSPIVLFGFAGLFLAYRRYPVEIMVIFSLILSFIIFYGKKYEAHGGAAFGPRYIVPILLLIGIGFGIILDSMKNSSLTQGGMIVTGIWSFFSTTLGALYAVLIFDFNINPLFEEALGKFNDGALNTPILRYLIERFPEVGGSLIGLIIAIITMVVVFRILLFLGEFCYEVIFKLSKQQGIPRETNDYEFVQAYSVFAIGNFLFVLVYFTELAYILSATYIQLWEENNQMIFEKILPASELWFIIAFCILTLHSLWNLFWYYHPQLSDLFQNLIARRKEDSE
ncbi:hypothetical protein CEE45_12675 [Candidatus Heimdallarchaeota archaeon B3_Heim]|nr:MAG: hypothetical protein CEE45_12675 [Candidatus Heimdallarchaeota archaeon B3_Heim]